jgi:hypothetical protein
MGSYIGADRCYTWELSQGNNVTLRKSPDFIIADTQKGGTSALYALVLLRTSTAYSTSSILIFFDRLQTQNHTFFIIEASAEPRSMPSVNIDKLMVHFGLHLLKRALVQKTCHLRKLRTTT